MTMGKGVVGRTLGTLFVLALVSCFPHPSTWARDSVPVGPSQEEQIGHIKRILGTVSIRRTGEARPLPARENAPVFLQDTLGTDQTGKAWWRSRPKGAGPQQSDASLGNGSALEFVRFDRDGTSSDFSGEVGQGMVRFIKDLPKSVPLSHFIISTPTTVIEVMSTGRPADFVVEVSKDQRLTTVYGIWGAVKVRHILPQFVEERIVRSCQRVDVEEDKEPGPVIGVSPETLKELIRKTTIPNTLPDGVPSCRDEAVVEPSVIDEELPGVTEPSDVVGPPGFVGCPCPHGQEQVGGVCVECRRWKTYDRHSCSCVSRCRHDKQCRRCETCRNGLCVPKLCPHGQFLDEKTCTCRDECRPIDCPQGFWFDPKTCRCERKPCDKKCRPGQFLDPKTCECTQRPSDCHRKCPPGQHLDPVACKCVSDGTVPQKGCKSDGECGPGSVCRDHRCVPKEGHVDKPSKHQPEHPVLPAQPRQQKDQRP